MKLFMYLLSFCALFIFSSCNFIFPGDDAATEGPTTESRFPMCNVERGECLTDHSCCMDDYNAPVEEPASAVSDYEALMEDAYEEYEDVMEDAYQEYENLMEDAYEEYDQLLEDAGYDDFYN